MNITNITPVAISSHADLKKRIHYLESLKDEQEEEVKQDMKAFFHSMQPSELIRNMAANLRDDQQFKADAGAVGLNYALDFVMGKFFGKNSSIGAYIKSTIMEQVIGFVIRNYGDKIGDLAGTLKDKLVSFFQKQTPREKNSDS